MAIVGRAKIHTRARNSGERRRDTRGTPNFSGAPLIFSAPFASHLLGISRACLFSPAPRSLSPKLETTRSSGCCLSPKLRMLHRTIFYVAFASLKRLWFQVLVKKIVQVSAILLHRIDLPRERLYQNY